MNANIKKCIMLKYCWTCKGLYLQTESEQINNVSKGLTEDKA